MGLWLADEGPLYHLQEYAILENKDGNHEYIAWDIDKKTGKLNWLRGPAVVLEDTLCLSGITSDGEEKNFETILEVKVELEQLPEWDKTRFFCVVLRGGMASLLKYCGTGNFAKKGSQEYKTVQNMLSKHGVTLPSQEAV